MLDSRSFLMMLYIFSRHILEKRTQMYVLYPHPTLLLPRFAPLFNFEASAFFLNMFRLGNIFGARPDLVKALVCPWYFSYFPCIIYTI